MVMNGISSPTRFLFSGLGSRYATTYEVATVTLDQQYPANSATGSTRRVVRGDGERIVICCSTRHISKDFPPEFVPSRTHSAKTNVLNKNYLTISYSDPDVL